MTKQIKQKMSSWIFWEPLKFAFIALAMMMAVAVLYGMVSSFIFNGANTPRLPLMILLTITFAGAAVSMLRRLPRENLDRRSFIALNNAQTFLVSLMFIVSTLLIVSNAQRIMLRMMWIEANSNLSFLMILIAAGLFYLYLAGTFIANIYAKFRRCRAMGISAGRTLCTLPFGFPLLWIPGYLLSDKAPRNPALPLKAKWYERLTDAIMKTPIMTTFVFVALVMFSGFFFGFNSILLTFAWAIVFAVWARVLGAEKFRKNIGGAYTSFAILANIVVLVSVILISTMTSSQKITTAQTQNIGIVVGDKNAD